ncbi:hypothetical protein [Mucilaginibacter sp. UYCu711]|uniref:hypothetical protein n=1 Tax=Mucilaginibacter sp. UYCu711 TaxID=3156339 RepID=UPI003D1D8ADD
MIVKKIAVFILIAGFFSCHKAQQQAACGTQTCTLVFAQIGVHFADFNGSPASVLNFSAINQRTKQSTVPASPTGGPAEPGYYIVADDNGKKDFSTEGDDVVVSGTSPTTGQTKTVTYKISGGCNCHVEKISGETTIVFN